ncbi:MAG: sprT domain-containing protein, partial [Crocinitomicaceae bacterium]|nr:sprT domain-containing protein [Crocinitomicaceae bacterium]
YGSRVNPHGEEWKNAFRELLIPVLDSKQLPKEVEKALWKSFTNTKASSCSDLNLSRALRQHDKPSEAITLEQIPYQSTFSINGKLFKKGNLRRSRYLCTDLNSGKQYLVHALANIKLITSYEK